MTRLNLLLPLLLLTARSLPAPEPGIEEFFERFTADWVRADPQLATTTQYFSGTEQDRLDGLLTPQTAEFRKEQVDRARRRLAELRRFDRKGLSDAQRISARVLDWQLDAIVQGARFDDHLYLFNQADIVGMPGALVTFLTDIHPARTPRDIANYLKRLSQFGARVDEMIVQARARASRGIVPPRFILTTTIDQIERLTEPEPGKNVLVESYERRLRNSPAISEDKCRGFHAEASKIVADSVVPALRRVIALLQEQRKTATDEAGVSRLPDGLAYYSRCLRYYTSTALSADQIHRMGLEQVARLEAQMDTSLRQLGYTEGSAKDRFSKAEDDHSYPDQADIRSTILADYEKIIRDAERRAAALFDLRPKAPIVVRRIPEFAERSSYFNYTLPARDGSRPGSFNVPLVGPKFSRVNMRTLAYHEGVPGHHFQRGLQLEDKDLPRFRSDRILTEGMIASSEGWGLYAEALAMESGWYEGDLPGKLGALNFQLFRARRLVIDTGLHTKGWTRQQAIDYGIPANEVERYVARPGQACAYMIGQLKIIELREKARRELGDKFSLKDFHNVMLRTGNVPLEVLEEVVDEYVANKKV